MLEALYLSKLVGHAEDLLCSPGPRWTMGSSRQEYWKWVATYFSRSFRLLVGLSSQFNQPVQKVEASGKLSCVFQGLGKGCVLC